MSRADAFPDNPFSLAGRRNGRFPVKPFPADATLARKSNPVSGAWRRPKPIADDPVPADAYEPEPLPLPQPDPETAPAKTLRLSNPRWQEASGAYPGAVTALVDAEDPGDLVTRVVFKSWMEWNEGGRKARKDLEDAEGHIDARTGIASASIPLDTPTDARNHPVPACKVHFTAKHSRSTEVASAPLEAKPGPDTPFEGAMYYSPARDEYLVLPEKADADALLVMANRLETHRDKARQAWENPDPGARSSALRDLEKESAELFGGASNASSNRALEELLLVQKNPRWGASSPWLYLPGEDTPIRKKTKAGLRAKAEARDQKERLKKLLQPKNRGLQSPLLNGKLKTNLFKSEPKAGDMWHWSSKADQEGKPKEEEGPKVFDFSSEAAVGRYFAGFDGVDAGYDKTEKKLKLGQAGKASFAAFEGRVTLAVELPDSHGVNIIAWLGNVKYKEAYLLDRGRACQVKLGIAGSLSSFVGASVHGALTLTGSLTGRPADGGAAEIGGQVGGQAKVDIRGYLKWAASPTGKFEELAAMAIGAGGSAGLGAELKMEVAYHKGKFRFRFSYAACLGLGLKEESAFEVSAAEGCNLIGHLLHCVDYHILTVLVGESFEAYRNYLFLLHTSVVERDRAVVEVSREQVEWVKKAYGNFRDWIEEQKENLPEIKARILANCGNRSQYLKTPPEVLGKLLAITMDSRKKSEFQIIQYILGSTVNPSESLTARQSNDHKLKWTLRWISETRMPESRGPALEIWKEDAMQDGLRVLREFGQATGPWEQSDQEYNREFSTWLEGFLKENLK